jgi:hypothetical protein
MQIGGKKNGPQVGQYDKILKENLEETLPVIIKEVLKLDVSHSEELPDDIQHTKERKPDVLKKVTDVNGESYVLHIEFQLKDEKEMVYRMAEYSVMLMRKYGLPIKQYVIFLMDTLPLMETAFNYEHHKYDFTLIRLSSINYRVFLKSKDPKVQLLGILGDFGGEDRYTAVESIIVNLEANTKGDLEKERNYNQLRIFIQLRTNIEQYYYHAMDSVSDFFRVERDPYYKRGIIKGKTETSEKMKHAFVKNLLMEPGFSDEQVARLAEVSIDYVQQVRTGLNNK